MKLTAILIALFFSIAAPAQNLLVNGGFEDINTCSEYNVECAPEAWISSLNSIFNFFKDPNRAHSGQNSMAVEAGHDRKYFSRTFIRSRLVCGLRKGNQYRLSFFIKSPHALFDSVGILFSATDPLLLKQPFHRLAPSVFLHNVTAPMHIADSNWYKIELDYTATGNEIFILLGYFGKNDFKGVKVAPREDRFYFYVDDISLSPLDQHESLCRGWESIKEEIYSENERHEWLERKLKYYQTRPPQPPVINKTAYVRIDTLVMPDILFASGKALLEPASYPMLDSFSRKIRSAHIDSVVIGGHTDSTGSLLLNQKLSLDRALAVRNYLLEKTGYNNIIARGWAYDKPVGDNRSPEGRKQNRRVEVFLYIRE